MKNFITLAFLLFLPGIVAAQMPDVDPNVNNNNPHTETAFLNYDYKFQQSGHQRVAGGPINVQPDVRGLLKFTIEDGYDYIFIGISDSSTQGISLHGKPVGFNSNMFEVDNDYVFKDWGSQILVYPFPDEFKGEVELYPMLLGKTAPKESSFYLLMRKKSSY